MMQMIGGRGEAGQGPWGNGGIASTGERQRVLSRLDRSSTTTGTAPASAAAPLATMPVIDTSSARPATAGGNASAGVGGEATVAGDEEAGKTPPQSSARASASKVLRPDRQ